jgi:hypothetical protein
LILCAAILTGLLAGLAIARWRKHSWELPPLRHLWLVALAFLPQFLTIYLPATRGHIPNTLVAAGLVCSQALLLLFCWLNWRITGIWPLALGTALNLTVIASNSGFMPISPQTVSHLVNHETFSTLELGVRFGYKDILLLAENTKFAWLSDRFLPPEWFPYQVAFSLGDMLIAIGAFWLTAVQGKPLLQGNPKEQHAR